MKKKIAKILLIILCTICFVYYFKRLLTNLEVIIFDFDIFYETIYNKIGAFVTLTFQIITIAILVGLIVFLILSMFHAEKIPYFVRYTYKEYKEARQKKKAEKEARKKAEKKADLEKQLQEIEKEL